MPGQENEVEYFGHGGLILNHASGIVKLLDWEAAAIARFKIACVISHLKVDFKKCELADRKLASCMAGIKVGKQVPCPQT